MRFQKPRKKTSILRGHRIYTGDRKRLAGEFNPDPEGRIRIELETGTYFVDMKPLGIDSTPDLPAEVRILSGEITSLKVSIDTGIRQIAVCRKNYKKADKRNTSE